MRDEQILNLIQYLLINEKWESSNDLLTNVIKRLPFELTLNEIAYYKQLINVQLNNNIPLKNFIQEDVIQSERI